MLKYIVALWKSDYAFYTFGSLFLIIAVWQFCYGFGKTDNRNCCRRQRKVRRTVKDIEERVWRSSQEDIKTPLELLSSLKRQTWVPQESDIRKLLCKDPSCSVCNTVALETKFLLSGENDLHSPPLMKPSPGPSCLETMTMSTFSLDQSLDQSSQSSPGESRLPPFLVQTSLTQKGSLSPSEVPVYQTEQVQLGKKLYVNNMESPNSVASSSSPEKPKGSAEKRDSSDNRNQFFMKIKEAEALRSEDILLNTEFLQLTRNPSAIQSFTVFPATLSFLNPDIQKLLETHIKKRAHFQKWGLPRRVEESLKQFMPESPLYYYPGNQKVPFIPEEDSKIPMSEMKTAAACTWAPWEASDQPSQPLLGPEMIFTDLGKAELKSTSEEFPNPVRTVLPPSSIPTLNDFSPLIEEPNKVKDSCLQEKYSQLFWGLPSLHSESLLATFLRNDSYSPPMNNNKLSSKDITFLFNELSFLPLLPKTPPNSTPPSSPPTPISCSIDIPKEAQIEIPFLPLAECDALDWHLIQRQLQMLWGLPPIVQRSQKAHNLLDHELCEENQILLHPCPKMNVSVFTKELFFFPEHSRRLLELHFQKRLLQHQLYLPQSIQDSVQLLLPQTNQLHVSESSSTKAYIKLLQNEDPHLSKAQANTPILSPAPITETELHIKAKEILQMHIEKKYLQIKQRIFPDNVYRSWDIESQLSAGGTPAQGVLEAVYCNKESEILSFQDPSATSWTELTMNQQSLTPLGKGTKQPDQVVTLPQSMIEKLEIILRHKYLAFLSGLPALYYVALYRAMSPLDSSQTAAPHMIQGVVREQIDPMSYRIWAEEQSILSTENNDSTMVSEDTENELQVSQKIKVLEAAPERGGDLNSPEEVDEPGGFAYPEYHYSPSKSVILTKMDSHLRKKELEVNMGIPQKAIDSRELSEPLESPSLPSELGHVPLVGGPESSEELQGTLSSLGSYESPKMCSSPVALEAEVPNWTHFKEQLSSELELSLMRISENHTQSCPTAVPLASSQIPSFKASKVTQSHPGRRPHRDMVDAQVLCVCMETAQSSPGQEKHWTIEPQTPGDSHIKAMGSTLNKIESSKGEDQGGGDAGWGTSSPKRSHAPASRRSTKHPVNRTHRLPYPGNKNHHHKAPLQVLSQSFPKDDDSRALFGVPGKKETERDNHKVSQSKLKDLSPPTKGSELSQSSGPKSPIRATQRAKGVQVSKKMAYIPQVPIPSENNFRGKLKHFLHWLSLKKKSTSQNVPHSFPRNDVASSKKDVTKQVLVSTKGSTCRGHNIKKNVDFKEHYYTFASNDPLVNTELPRTSQVHHPNCKEGLQHFRNSGLCRCSKCCSHVFIQQENDPSSLWPSKENFASLRKKTPVPTKRAG